jgi:hypothetical protein
MSRIFQNGRKSDTMSDAAARTSKTRPAGLGGRRRKL